MTFVFKTRLGRDVSLDSGDAMRRRGEGIGILRQGGSEGEREKGRVRIAGIKEREHRATISFRHGAQIPRDTRGGVALGGGQGHTMLPLPHNSGISLNNVHKIEWIFTCGHAGLYVGRVLQTTNALFCQTLKY